MSTTITLTADALLIEPMGLDKMWSYPAEVGSATAKAAAATTRQLTAACANRAATRPPLLALHPLGEHREQHPHAPPRAATQVL